MCSAKLSGRVLFIFVYGGAYGGSNSNPKMDSLRFCTQKYGDPAYLLPNNMGDNFSLLINLMVRNYFWGITKMNLEKNGNC